MPDTGLSLFFAQVELTLSNSNGSNSQTYTLNSASDSNSQDNSKGGMFFESLTYKRFGGNGAANQLTLNLIDNTSVGLEQKLCDMNRYITLKYTGCRQEKGKLVEKKHGPYKLIVTDWQTKMTSYGSHLSINAVSIGIDVLSSSIPRTKNEKGYTSIYFEGPPHKVVGLLLNNYGFETKTKAGASTIEETQSVMVDDMEGENPTKKVEKKYMYNGGSIVDFIKTEIIPDAKSTDPKHERPFALFFRDGETDSGKPLAFFQSLDTVVTNVSQKHSVKFEFNTKDSFIEIWNPVYSGKQLLGINTVIVNYNDNGKVGQVKAENDTKQTDKLAPITITGNMSKEEAQRLADDTLGRRQFFAQKANMTLINYSDVNVGDLIEVLVYTKEKSLHHSSGVFYVKGVTDNIRGGTIRTELELLLYRALKKSDTEGKTVSTTTA